MLARSLVLAGVIAAVTGRVSTGSPVLNWRTLVNSQPWLSIFGPYEPPGTSFRSVSLGGGCGGIVRSFGPVQSVVKRRDRSDCRILFGCGNG